MEQGLDDHEFPCMILMTGLVHVWSLVDMVTLFLFFSAHRRMSYLSFLFR